MNYSNTILDLLEKAEDLKFEGENLKSIEILEKIITEEPNCTEAFEELGDNYLSLKQLNKAQKALEQAIRIKEDSSNAHYLLGFLHSISGDWKNSVEELKKSNTLMPNHPEILRCLGWAFYNDKRAAQGVSILERSLTLRPNDPHTLCDLGICYMNTEKYKKSFDLFTKALEIDPQSEQALDCLKVLNSLTQNN